jgi:pimeloyl-ACP methyl ester carboxylesterase
MTKAAPIYSGRTRFDDDIVAEFWMPRKPSGKAVILLDGCPSVPSKRKVGEFFARRGYWVFHPRYRGSWESDGVFLEESPEEDVLIVAEGLNAGFQNIYDGIEYILDIHEIVVVGASFGGAAAVLSLKYPIISKAIALAPVIDWQAKSEAEPFDYFLFMIEQGFGGAYRPHKDAWKRLMGGKFYSPKYDSKEIDTSRLFVAHALDDKVISVLPLKQFAAQKKIKPMYLKKGGHFSVSKIMDKEIWSKASVFLKK